MKKMLTMFAVFFTFTLNAFAHPPANMRASYDTDTNSITVNLRHRTLDGDSHRISSYEVIVEGETLEFVRESQDGNEPTETLELGDIVISENSKVTIIAKCSFYGSLNRNYYFSDSNLIEVDQDN